MGLQEQAKQLRSAIADFQTIEGFSRTVIKKYESRLKEIEKEFAKDKKKRKNFLRELNLPIFIFPEAITKITENDF